MPVMLLQLPSPARGDQGGERGKRELSDYMMKARNSLCGRTLEKQALQEGLEEVTP